MFVWGLLELVCDVSAAGWLWFPRGLRRADSGNRSVAEVGGSGTEQSAGAGPDTDAGGGTGSWG